VKIIDILKLSINNLSQRSLRSWLTIIGIVIGTASIISILSIGEGMRSNILSQLSVFGQDVLMILPGSVRSGGGDISSLIRIMLQARGSRTLSNKDINAIKYVEGIKDVEGEIIGMTFVTFGNERRSTSIRGVETIKWKKMLNVEIEEGRNFQPNEKGVVILGYRIAKEGFSQKIEVGSQITIGNKYFKVIGILKESGTQIGLIDNVVFMNIEDAREILKIESDKYSLINVKISDISRIDEIINEIDKRLMNERKETPNKKSYTIISAKQIAQTVESIVLTLNIFLGGVAGVSLIVGAIGIANTMFTSVLERTRQIGTLKALGTKNSEIMLIFLFESILIGFIGGLIGTFFGFISTGILNEISVRVFAQREIIVSQAIITPNLIFIGISFAVIIGTISGIIPARKAAKLEPVEALRYE